MATAAFYVPRHVPHAIGIRQVRAAGKSGSGFREGWGVGSVPGRGLRSAVSWGALETGLAGPRDFCPPQVPSVIPQANPEQIGRTSPTAESSLGPDSAEARSLEKKVERVRTPTFNPKKFGGVPPPSRRSSFHAKYDCFVFK